ncbi:actin interacting protein 3-domain-containing protein [Pisolithus microcarpus]|nr:actin interacting protein 3-domain-containing protein [Pisolithus microcarpus]
MASTQPPPSYDGHKPKRDNQSVSSTSSRSGRSHSHPTVESAVTRLLVAIKQLLESLTLWSNLQMSESQISDVYVRLGNDFNAAVAAFASFNIDMSDLMSVPEDLREVLETCLSEDASPDTLNIYLPKVRQIITNLLHGLRNKQSMYRRIVSDHQSRHRSSSHARTDSRSSRSNRASSKRDEEVAKHRTQLSLGDEEERNVETNRNSAAVRTSARPSSKRPETRSRMTPPPFEEPEDDPPVSERPVSTNTNGHHERTPQPSQSRHSQPPSQNAVYAPQDDVSARASTETLIASQTHTPSASVQLPNTDKDVPPTPPPQFSPVPASVKRYSLVDRPSSPPVASPPTVIIEPSSVVEDTHSGESSSPKTPPMETDVPGVASSLAALRNRDVLERRASKRFSTYQFSRMAGNGLTRERTISSSPSRRSMAVSSNLTPVELAVLTEVDESETKSPAGSSKKGPRTPSPANKEPTPPVPPLPFPTDMVRAQSISKTLSNRSKLSEEVEFPDSSQTASFPVFLQVGREVKKAMFESGTTVSSLRMLFVDKFSYNPGMENFPAIYIRDPSSGVQYELEDMEEIKEKCLLSLNIEPLDQIKQHIDAQISTLSNDLKELKSAITHNRRSSHHPSPIVAHEFAESTPVADRPSDKQFQHIARRLSRIVGDTQSPFIQPEMTGQSLQLQPQMTGASVMSEYSNRVVNDLKTQFDEVQNLRRDLGIMRQLYSEFMKSTKESLNVLRTQTQSVKQLASAKVGGSRSFIDSGKGKLDTRSQNVLTKVEELQDTVESLRDDVIKRQITPKPQLLKTIREDVVSTATELSSLKDHLDTIKPMWKKTWEEELQNIVEEQGFLSHQEELLADLLEDHKGLAEVFDHVQKVVNLRNNTPNRSARGRFKALPADEGHGGLSTVMMEIRGASVDPEKRLKAIAANQKNRERELASRSDAFQNELAGFVGGKKLKMTGGTEEAERVRQKRNELALKAMFNSSAATPVPADGGGSGQTVQSPVLSRPSSK